MPETKERMKAGSKEDGHRLRTGRPAVVLFVALALLGALLGYLVSGAMGHRVLKGVSMAGKPLAGLRSAEVRALLKAQCEPLGDIPVVMAMDSKTWQITPFSAGLSIDYEECARRALRAGRSGGLLFRLRERRSLSRQGREVPLAVRVEMERWEKLCRAIESEVNQEPLDVHLTVSRAGQLRVAPSREGRVLNRAGFAAILRAALYEARKRRSDLPITVVAPRLSSQDVARWPLDQVLSVYTTKFNRSDTQRSHNLEMATVAIDGVVVGSGEEFSFNEYVGPRVPEAGYLEAPVLKKNRLVLGIGGGVCQVSGTLFNVALLANLPVVKRSTHSVPSTYVPLGRDATVVYEGVDLAFANDTGKPIVITGDVQGSYLTVAIVGHREVRPIVSISVEIKEKIPFETVTENDPGLAAGIKAVTQKGREGYKVQLWRMVTWPDKRVIREPIGGVAYYPPAKEIIKNGIGSPRFGSMPMPPAAAAEQTSLAPTAQVPIPPTDEGNL